MSRPSSNSYGDLSIPEITTELWSQLCHIQLEGLESSINNGGSTIEIDVDPASNNAVTGTIPKVEEEYLDSGLWEEFSDIQAEDLLEVESETATQTPAPVNTRTSFPPLYLILEKLFDEVAFGDIEEGGMSVWRAGNLISKYKYNGSLSVSNIVQPLWCEYKAYYNLVGLERRGVERRSKEFEVSRKVVVDNKVVDKTVVIKVDQAAVHKGERHKVRGLKIHERLEREVAVPLQISIRPKTQEEIWGLKLFDMITGLAVLKKKKRWRELPVFGFIRNIPVNGVIDELVLEPSPKSEGGNVLKISDTKTKLARSRVDREPPKEHKVQLMLYKFLLDGLLVPDYDWAYLFKTYRLDYLENFSDGFIAKTVHLAQVNELGNAAEAAKNLEDLIIVWDTCVKNLNLVRGVVEPGLSVEYHTAIPSLPPLDTISEPIVPADSGESKVVACQTFEYDGDFVQQAVFQSLEFWLGTRQQIGVDVDETWKCDVCEYKADCEWRAEQASVYSQKMASKH